MKWMERMAVISVGLSKHFLLTDTPSDAWEKKTEIEKV